MNLVLGVLALIPVWLLGSFLVGLADLRSEDATDLPLEFAAGVTVFGIIGTVLVVAGIELSILVFYALLVVAALAGLGRGRGRGGRPRLRLPPTPQGTPARALCILSVALLTVIVTAALHDRLSWDGFAIWVLKARILWVDGGFPADFWTRPGPFEFAHADYPLALPLLNWWLFAHAGEAATNLASFAGGIWFALLVWLFWSALALGGRPGVFSAAATLGLTVFWPIAYFAIGGTADVVMALVFLGVVLELTRAHRSADHQPLLRALVYVALGALTKNEGLAVAVVAGLAVAAIALRRGWRRPALLALIPVALGGTWRWWSASMGAEVEQLADAVAFGGVRAIALIAEGFARLAIDGEWPPLFLIVAIGLWRWRSEKIATQTPAWALIAGYAVVVIGVYLTTDEDLAWLLATSLGRVLSAVVPAALFLTFSGLSAADRRSVAPIDTARASAAR